MASVDVKQILLRESRLELSAIRYAYFSKHVADESRFGCHDGTIECSLDIHVRRMANISDMNVQATGTAAMDRASGTWPVSISRHSGFGHNAINFRGEAAMDSGVVSDASRVPDMLSKTRLLLKDAGRLRSEGGAQQNAERSDMVRSLGTGAEKTKWEGLRQVHPYPTRKQMLASGDESRGAY